MEWRERLEGENRDERAGKIEQRLEVVRCTRKVGERKGRPLKREYDNGEEG